MPGRWRASSATSPSPEFVKLTQRTLDTVARLPQRTGHLYNWYDTHTLEALSPRFVSTVDSGNLAASLITLQGGCFDLLQRPLLNPALLDGYADHLCALAELNVVSKKIPRSFEEPDESPWLDRLLAPVELRDNGDRDANAQWFAAQTNQLVGEVQDAVSQYMPWLLPEFAAAT